MNRYTADHQAGKSGRDAVLVDDRGRRVLGLRGDWGVTNDDGRTTVFLAPGYAGMVRSAVVSGIIGAILDVPADTPARWANAGEGRQVVKRGNPPVRGVPARWTPVATVIRERHGPGEPDGFRVEIHEPDLPPVAFAQPADPATLAGYRNGFSDPRFGVYDLLHADGRPILRHWASIDTANRLTASVFDVEDDAFPLPEAVVLCLARVQSWRS